MSRPGARAHLRRPHRLRVAVRQAGRHHPDLKIVPQLAQSWTTSDDNKTLTFKLRKDAVFHDGAPVDAAAVKANLERARTLPDSNRKSELATVASVEAPDAETVVLRLSEPDASLLSQLSDRAGMMMSPAAFDKGSRRQAGVLGSVPVQGAGAERPHRAREIPQVLGRGQLPLRPPGLHPDSRQHGAPEQSARRRPDIIERVAPSDAKAVRMTPACAWRR